MSRTQVERTAARVVVIAPDGAALLVHGCDPADPGRGMFYWTPGGGLREGEAHEAAARRELREETGLVVDAIGPVVLNQVVELPFGGRDIRQTERFMLLFVNERFDPTPTALSHLETQAIERFEWMTAEEMRLARDVVYPDCLPDLIEHCIDHGAPDPAWVAN